MKVNKESHWSKYDMFSISELIFLGLMRKIHKSNVDNYKTTEVNNLESD